MAITTSGVYWLTMEKFLTLGTGLTSWEGTCDYGLATDASAPNFDTDAFRNSANLTEVPATGNYTAGGNVLGSPALTISSGMKYDFTDPQWTSSTITDAMGGFVNSGNATASADEIYFLQDFITSVSTVNGTLDVVINTAGALTFS